MTTMTTTFSRRHNPPLAFDQSLLFPNMKLWKANLLGKTVKSYIFHRSCQQTGAEARNLLINLLLLLLLFIIKMREVVAPIELVANTDN